MPRAPARCRAGQVRAGESFLHAAQAAGILAAGLPARRYRPAEAL